MLGNARHGLDLRQNRRQIVGGSPVDTPAGGRRRSGGSRSGLPRGGLVLRRRRGACGVPLPRCCGRGLCCCRLLDGLRRWILAGATLRRRRQSRLFGGLGSGNCLRCRCVVWRAECGRGGGAPAVLRGHTAGHRLQEQAEVDGRDVAAGESLRGVQMHIGDPDLITGGVDHQTGPGTTVNAAA